MLDTSKHRIVLIFAFNLKCSNKPLAILIEDEEEKAAKIIAGLPVETKYRRREKGFRNTFFDTARSVLTYRTKKGKSCIGQL